MALIKCPECGRDVSDKAVSCPNCGCPASINSVKSDSFVWKDGNTITYNGIDINLDEIVKIYGISISGAISYVKRTYGITQEEAEKIFEDYFAEIDIVDSKGSRIIKQNGNVKIFSKKRQLYDGKEKDVRIIGLSKFIFSNGCITFGFPGTIFRLNFYPKSKDDYLLLQQTFNDKVHEYYQTEERFKEKEQVRKAEQKAGREQQKLIKAQTEYFKSQVRCPKCHSTSISYDTKKLSFGRALVGDALAGPTGAILGGLSSKKGYAVCLNCGKRWKI